MKISKEARIGILALSAGAMLYFGFNFLKGKNVFSSNHKYYAIYPDIQGLAESNPVMLNGKTIGKVLTTEFLKNRNNQVLVAMEVRKDLVLNDSSIAKIDVTLLGNKSVVLTIGNGKKVKLSGDTLIGRIPGDMLANIQNKATVIIDSLAGTMAQLNSRLKEFETVEANLNVLMKSFTLTANNLNGTLNENRGALKNTLDNFNNLSAALNDPKTGVKSILAKLNTVGDSLTKLQLTQTLEKANQTIGSLNRMLTKVNEGQGSFGKLFKTDSLHLATVRTIADLDSLFTDLKAHPKRYVTITVFGRKEKKPEKKK